MSVRRAIAIREASSGPLTVNHVRRLMATGVVAAAFFGLDASWVESRDSLQADRSLELDMHARMPHAWQGIMSTMSFVGGGGAVFALALAAVMVLVWLRFHKAAIITLVAPALALGLESLFKAIFRRPRPHLWPSAQVLHSFSFPSGHATGSAALAAALIWVAYRHAGRRATLVTAVLATAFAVGVGLSRIYLGVHWPSDVCGGYALATCSVAAVVLLTERLYPTI